MSELIGPAPRTPPRAANAPGSPVVANPQDGRLRDIDLIGQRISAIIRFMCDPGGLPGISGEARDKALAAFHERLVIVEKQLSHIQEKVRLE